jgi:hypothetical protein
MRLNIKAFALAAGITAAAAFTVCALFVAVVPGLATSFFSDVTHLELTGMSRTLSWATYFEGLLFWSLGTAAVFGFAGWVYNAVSGSQAQKPIPVRPVTQHG